MDVKWIKLSTDLFNNRKIRQIERMDDGDAIIVIWLKLLILAGEINDGGEIYFTKEIPFTEESLAVELGRDRGLVALALRTFEAYGMIVIEEHSISVRNWERYQNVQELDKIREQNRNRQQKFRSKKKDNVTDNVTVTLRNATDKIRKDKNRKEENRLEGGYKGETPEELMRKLQKQWQRNVDGEEANKEIRQ